MQREDFIGDVAAEAFEAALGILQAGQRQHAHDGVEHPPGDVAVGGFVVAHRAGGLARADGHLHVRQRGRDEAGHLGDGHGKIGVGEEAVAAARGQHAHFDGQTLAALGGMQHAQVGHALRIGLSQRQGAVAAAVFNDDDFTAEILPA